MCACFDNRIFQEVKQHALRLLQCRLLLLSHASKCTAQEGDCQLSPLCDSVRQLLDHMQHCRDRCVRVVPIKYSGVVDSSPATTPCVTLYLPNGSVRVRLWCRALLLGGERGLANPDDKIYGRVRTGSGWGTALYGLPILTRFVYLKLERSLTYGRL